MIITTQRGDFAIALLLGLALTMSACGKDDPGNDPTPVGTDMEVMDEPDMEVVEEDMEPPPRVVQRIVLAPGSQTLEVGEELDLVASLYDEDDELIEEDRLVSWGSSAQGVATVNARGHVTAVSVGEATITATSGEGRATALITVEPRSVDVVEVTPAEASVRVRSTVQLSAKAVAADGTELLDREVGWRSSNPEIASITTSGLVTGQSAGEVLITATADGVSGTATVTVSPRAVARVELLVQDINISVNQTVQLDAVTRDDGDFILDDRVIEWSTGDDTIATISSDGELTGVAPGVTEVTATSEGVSASTQVTVSPQAIDSILLRPSMTTLRAGETLQMMATPLDALGNPLEGRALTWSTTNMSVLQVDQAGLVTAVGPGLARVRVAAEGESAEASIEVVYAVDNVEVTPAMPSVIVGETVQLDAKAYAMNGAEVFRPTTWSSGDPTLATVDMSGLVTGVAPGTVTITATSEGVDGVASVEVLPRPIDRVEVTPSVEVLFPGDTLQLAVTLYAADDSVLTGRTINWSTSDMNVAAVDSSGLVTAGTQTGEATITATSEGVAGEAKIVVPVTFKTIAAGGTHSCGVAADDRLYCWGRNQENALGLGPGAMDQYYPTLASTQETFDRISTLTVHTCALTPMDEVYCWGSNRSGQVGNGLANGTISSPYGINTALRFEQISAGGSHSCGLTAAGQAYCWGDNDYGQIGDDTLDVRPAPKAVAGNHVFTHIAAGGSHTCAVEAVTNFLYCWGRNNAGQLGIANMSADVTLPTKVDQMQTFSKVTGGPSHTCALTTTGQAYCWGGNSDGQLGQSTMGVDSVTALAVGGNHTFEDIFAGATHTCALKANGEAWCWGANNNGQLGDGTTTPSATPVQVGGGHTFDLVDTGALHTCAIDDRGVAYCWGSNSQGRLGNGTNLPSALPFPVVMP